MEIRSTNRARSSSMVKREVYRTFSQKAGSGPMLETSRAPSQENASGASLHSRSRAWDGPAYAAAGHFEAFSSESVLCMLQVMSVGLEPERPPFWITNHPQSFPIRTGSHDWALGT